MEWNPEHEKFLKKLRNEIYIMSEMHKHVAMTYSKKNKWLGTPSLLIGAAATSSVFSNSEVSYMVYVNGSLVLLTTLMNTLRNWLNYDKRADGHRLQSVEYESLALDITTQLNNDAPYREQVDRYMATIKDRYINLKNSTLNIPDYIYKKYVDDVEVFMSKLTDKEIVYIGDDSSYSTTLCNWLCCCRHRYKNDKSALPPNKFVQSQTVRPTQRRYEDDSPERRYEDDSPQRRYEDDSPERRRSGYSEESSGLNSDEETPLSRTKTQLPVVVVKKEEERPRRKSISSEYHMDSITEDMNKSMDQRISNIM